MDPKSYLDDFVERDWQTIEDGGAIRVAVVGLGWYARTHALPALDDAEFCEPTVAVSGSPETARQVENSYDLDRTLTYEDFHAGDGTQDYDAVYIATPTARHLEHATAAASLGKDVLCEKPLEATVDRARQLIQACEDAGTTLMVAYRMQCDPTVRRMRHLIREGVIGDPVHIHGALSLQIRDLDSPWRFDPEVAGGGVLMEDGIYPLNTSRFLLESDPTSVQATMEMGTDVLSAVEEHVSFQLHFPNGSTAVCTSSYGAAPDSHLRVIGTEGVLRLESAFFSGARRELTVERGSRRVTVTGRPENEVIEEFDYFAHCLLTDTPPEPDGSDGLTDLEVIDAIYTAAADATLVHL